MQARRILGVIAPLMLSASVLAAQGTKPTTQAKPAAPATTTAKPADSTHKSASAMKHATDSTKKTRSKARKAKAGS